MNRTGSKAIGVLVACLLVGATACGGGSSSSSESDDEKVSATVPSDSSSDSGSSSDSDNSDMGELLDGMGGDCMQAGLAYFALSISALGASFGASESDLAEMQSSIDELKAEIPSEIEEDFNVYADALSEYADAMKGLDMGDLLSGSSQAEDAAKVLETPEVKQAQENIDAYFEKECPSASTSS